MHLDLLSALNVERDARRAAILVTDIASGVDPEVHDLLQAMPQTIRLRTLS